MIAVCRGVYNVHEWNCQPAGVIDRGPGDRNVRLCDPVHAPEGGDLATTEQSREHTVEGEVSGNKYSVSPTRAGKEGNGTKIDHKRQSKPPVPQTVTTVRGDPLHA